MRHAIASVELIVDTATGPQLAGARSLGSATAVSDDRPPARQLVHRGDDAGVEVAWSIQAMAGDDLGRFAVEGQLYGHEGSDWHAALECEHAIADIVVDHLGEFAATSHCATLPTLLLSDDDWIVPCVAPNAQLRGHRAGA